MSERIKPEWANDQYTQEELDEMRKKAERYNLRNTAKAVMAKAQSGVHIQPLTAEYLAQHILALTEEEDENS